MLVDELVRDQAQTLVTTTESTPLIEVINVFTATKVSALIVTDETGQTVGIVSEQDVVRSIARFGPGAFTYPISRVEREDLVKCSCNEPVKLLARRMVEDGLRHVAVFRGGVLVGVISSEDLLSCLAQDRH